MYFFVRAHVFKAICFKNSKYADDNNVTLIYIYCSIFEGNIRAEISRHFSSRNPHYYISKGGPVIFNVILAYEYSSLCKKGFKIFKYVLKGFLLRNPVLQQKEKN